MNQLQSVKEYLSTGIGTEGQLLIPRKIADTLILAVTKRLIPRSEAAYYFGPEDIPGSSIDVDLETANSLSVREVSEGAEFPLDDVDYTTFNMKPKKYGVGIRITREMMEDAKWNMLQGNVTFAGKRVADNENSLVISDALDNASNTVTGGAAAQLSNITRAMQYLEDADFNGTTLAVGTEFLQDLRLIDTLVEYQKSGNTDMLNKGYLGNIYGLNVIRVSTNAGMTTTSAYVFDNTQAYAIAEKRRMTIEGFELPTFDMTGTVVSTRLKIRHARADAIAKITTS